MDSNLRIMEIFSHPAITPLVESDHPLTPGRKHGFQLQTVELGLKGRWDELTSPKHGIVDA
jgi:hypothetical protein